MMVQSPPGWPPPRAPVDTVPSSSNHMHSPRRAAAPQDATYTPPRPSKHSARTEGEMPNHLTHLRLTRDARPGDCNIQANTARDHHRHGLHRRLPSVYLSVSTYLLRSAYRPIPIHPRPPSLHLAPHGISRSSSPRYTYHPEHQTAHPPTHHLSPPNPTGTTQVRRRPSLFAAATSRRSVFRSLARRRSAPTPPPPR